MSAIQTSVATSTDVCFPGMEPDSSQPGAVNSYLNEEASAEIPFGVMVGQGVTDGGCLLLAATSDKLIGVVMHSHAYAKDLELGDDGLKPSVTVGVKAKGRAWVLVEEDVTPASDVLVRAVATGNEVAGAFRDTADASDCIDISAWARYVKSSVTLADGSTKVALVEFDVTNRGADKID